MVRNHPYDICGGKHNAVGFVEDKSESALQFILKCKRIILAGADVDFEAMIWNKETYAIANSPYVFMANRSWVPSVEIELLNFVCFGFYIPYECLGNFEYMRWRLKNPSEMEIYIHNLNYYMEKFSLNDLLEGGGEIWVKVLAAKTLPIRILKRKRFL